MTRLQVRVSAAMNIGSREEQEDSVNASLPDLPTDTGVLCVVSDGMGGLANGKIASQTVADTMVSVFEHSPINEPPAQVLLRGLANAQAGVRRLQHIPGECGATLIAAIVENDQCSFLSVGDSRIYLYRGGGLILLTRDQNRGRWIDAQIGLGRLPEEARIDKKRGALTAYVGMEEFTQADRSSRSFSVGHGDRIVLMTDGVYSTLTEKEIAEALDLPEEMVANTLIARTLAKRNPYQDNCSVAIIDCSLIGEGEGGG